MQVINVLLRAPQSRRRSRPRLQFSVHAIMGSRRLRRRAETMVITIVRLVPTVILQGWSPESVYVPPRAKVSQIFAGAIRRLCRTITAKTSERILHVKTGSLPRSPNVKHPARTVGGQFAVSLTGQAQGPPIVFRATRGIDLLST